ncbi:hypothetical protein VTL71DRAFT_5019 [Oculimacula yallundae]|uniref:Uncharacterized protein n=1 Tax=Oculimacula yallundae TaxID=86028 RepID=A0ABR4C037_9HELO
MDTLHACSTNSLGSSLDGSARVKGIATSTASSTETDRSEGLRTPAILSVITNHDASSLSLGHSGNRNVAAGGDDCQPANVYSEWMSRSSVEDGADTATDDGIEDEIDCSDVDDPSGVSPRLVSDSACLSQYYSRGLAQAFEDTLAPEETTSQSFSRVSSCSLAQIRHLRGESQSLPTSRSSMCHNTTSTEPPAVYTIPVSTAGQGNSSLDTHRSDDAPRKASPSIDALRIQTEERHTSLADPLALLTGSTVSPDMLSRIPSPELANLWHYLRSQRASLPEGLEKAPAITDPREAAADRIKRLLGGFQSQYEILPSNDYFPDLYRRLYLANIHGLKEQEARIRQTSPRPKRERKRQRINKTPKGARRSLNDDFVDFLLPQLLMDGDTRQDAKGRFGNWLALGRTCSRLTKEFGAGIFLRLPRDIPNETLRDFSVMQEDALIAHLNQTQPNLKSDIKNLTAFLVQVVEDQGVPSNKLKLETLSEHDMESRERAGGSLKDLFEFSDEINYTSFLADEALSPLYPPSPETPACFDTHIFDSPDQSILNDAEYLGDGKSMERFDGDFFLV